MSGAGTLPPLFVISSQDHGGYVCVAVYTLLCLMVVTVFARLLTRWYIIRFIKSDDIVLALATILGILQSVFVQLAVNHGLGKTRAIVSDGDFVMYEKYEYVAQILLVATLACGKTSLALLVKSLMAEGRTLLASQGLIAVIILWGFSSIMALAFRCKLPRPWEFTEHSQCIDQDALFKSIAAFNIITDAALILLPCTVFWRVRISNSRRWRIVALFAARIIVCIATAIQIHYFSILVKSTDKTWANINSSLWDQAMMNLSIIATAIPSLGRLIVELQPTINAFAITEQHGLRTGDKYALSSLAGRFPQDYSLENNLGTHTTVKGSVRRQSNRSNSESTQGLRENIIQQTIDFRIY